MDRRNIRLGFPSVPPLAGACGTAHIFNNFPSGPRMGVCGSGLEREAAASWGSAWWARANPVHRWGTLGPASRPLKGTAKVAGPQQGIRGAIGVDLECQLWAPQPGLHVLPAHNPDACPPPPTPLGLCPA